jgi:hypothetical protein
MGDFEEHFMCIKFRYKPLTSITETYKMSELAFGNKTTGRTETIDRISMFKS